MTKKCMILHGEEKAFLLPSQLMDLFEFLTSGIIQPQVLCPTIGKRSLSKFYNWHTSFDENALHSSWVNSRLISAMALISNSQLPFWSKVCTCPLSYKYVYSCITWPNPERIFRWELFSEKGIHAKYPFLLKSFGYRSLKSGTCSPPKKDGHFGFIGLVVLFFVTNFCKMPWGMIIMGAHRIFAWYE